MYCYTLPLQEYPSWEKEVINRSRATLFNKSPRARSTKQSYRYSNNLALTLLTVGRTSGSDQCVERALVIGLVSAAKNLNDWRAASF